MIWQPRGRGCVCLLPRIVSDAGVWDVGLDVGWIENINCPDRSVQGGFLLQNPAAASSDNIIILHVFLDARTANFASSTGIYAASFDSLGGWGLEVRLGR